MIAATVEAHRWRPGRWWFLIALIFSVQLALILWLGNKSPVRPRPPATAPMLRLAGNDSGEVLALSDPTLFALPHREGFSGAAWLRIPPMKFRSFDWSEPTNWLSLPVLQLGAVLTRFIETNQINSAPVSASPEPELTLPEGFLSIASRDHSTLRLEGGLAARTLLTPLKLRSWEYADILSNTVVRMVLNEDGVPFSPPILLFSSGYKAADQHALELAKAARFNSVRRTGPGRVSNPVSSLTWGDMIFEWQTLAVAPTNIPTANP